MDRYVENKGHVVDTASLPVLFPTHLLLPEFWECLGRAVAAFGFLEEILGKAIFAFTATKKYDESEIEAAYRAWLPTLQRALADPLGRLIDTFERAVRSADCSVNELDTLLDDLRQASQVRDVLCHGSWRAPDASGRSLPLFVNRKQMVWDTPIGVAFLRQTRQAVAELACAVVSAVTAQGWQFPGSEGPGTPVYDRTDG